MIFDTLRNYSSLAIADIVRLTNISKPTVVKVLAELAEEKYIIKGGKGESIGGRRPELYQFNHSVGFIVGVNFEIPKVKIVAVDLANRILEEKTYTVNLQENIPQIMNKLISSIHEIIGTVVKASPIRLIGIGVAISGYIAREEGISLSTPRIPQWKNVAIGEIFKKEYNVPVHLMNGANARMIAEIEYGNIKKASDNLIYIVFSEGLGAGILINGKLLRGKYGNAGNLSHITVNPEGPKCICGNHGCLECYASERGVIQRVKEIKRTSETHFGKLDNDLTMNDIIRLFKEGDPICRRVFADMIKYMGIEIANIIKLLEVDLVVIGGSIVEAGEDFKSKLDHVIQANLQDMHRTSLSLEFAKLQDLEAGAIGATVQILSEFFKEPELRLHSQKIEFTNSMLHANQ
jgi:predicted NBD/HSP70 family sugar kinase